MNFDVQKITLPLDLGAYDAAYAGKTVNVWVNLPAALRQKRVELLRGLAQEIAAEMRRKGPAPRVSWVRQWRERLFAALRMTPRDDMESLMSQVWSAGEKATRWPVAEIRTMQAADPLLYAWLVRESWRMIDEWQDARKKKS